MTKSEITGKLRDILVAKDFNISTKDMPLLEYEVDRAISEINKCRRFKPTETVLYDKKYESLIIPLCISAFAKSGAEGQISHSENGIVRNYTSGGDYPEETLNSIIPLIK